MPLGEEAERLARHLVHISADGLSDPMSWPEVTERWSGTDPSLLEEAAYELQNAGFAEVGVAIGGISSIRPEYELFWTYDAVKRGFDSRADAASLAQLILDEPSLASIPALHERTGWPKRRLNPAVALVGTVISPGRTSREVQPDYATMGFSITAEDRVALRQLIEECVEAESPAVVLPGSPSTQSASVSARIKLPFVDLEIPVPRWVALVVALLAASVIVVWYWPEITARLLPRGFQGEAVRLVGPPNGAEFSRFPRSLEFRWQALEGAERYVVFVEGQDPETGEWFPHPGRSSVPVDGTTLSFEFIGSQPGRWRVVGIDSAGEESKSSPWWTFFFNDEAGGSSP